MNPGMRLPVLPVAANLAFGAGGGAGICQVAGWSHPEDGFTWTDGPVSSLLIPYAAGDGVLMLQLHAFPFRMPGRLDAQRLLLTANGTPCGEARYIDDAVLAILLPNIVSGAGGTLDLRLHNLDAAAPADFGGSDDRRRLALGVRRMRLVWSPPEPPARSAGRPPLRGHGAMDITALVQGCTAIPAPELMHCFESLGHNCEFGLVQRQVGVNPLGLLRFGGIPTAELLAGLECGFEGIEDPGQITLLEDHNAGCLEYLVRSERYHMQFHSFIAMDAIPADRMRHRMAVYLGFLRQTFVETLCSGSKIFVFHHGTIVSHAQILPYLAALRAWGPNTLLWVTHRSGQAGAVDQLSAHLLQGHTDIRMEDPGQSANVPAWLSLCANAYRLWREGGSQQLSEPH
jgi:hypothetical protein